jgi:hypothetical protein
MLSGTEYEFYSPSNFLTTSGSNHAYFLSETLQGWQISFGDNTFGYMPPNGSVVRVTYMLSSGAAANGCVNFTFTGTTQTLVGNAYVSTTSNSVIKTSTASQGGTDAESIQSIQTNAPAYYTTQNRAVTANDYKVLIKANSNNVKDVLVWGGQDNIPPMFGKVVACVQPNYGDSLTKNDMTNLQTILAGLSVPNIGVVFVPPTYINLIINTIVTYSSSQITLSVYDLQTTIQNSIANYITTNVSKFSGVLRLSNLSTMIDSIDPSIVSDITTVQLKYEYTPTLYQSVGIKFSYNNALDNTNKGYVMKSTPFFVSGQNSGVWAQDDGAGTINLLYSTITGSIAYAQYGIGTINYLTGAVNITSILITGISGSTIDFVASPTNSDLGSANQNIIVVSANDITVSTKANN